MNDISNPKRKTKSDPSGLKKNILLSVLHNSGKHSCIQFHSQVLELRVQHFQRFVCLHGRYRMYIAQYGFCRCGFSFVCFFLGEVIDGEKGAC